MGGGCIRRHDFWKITLQLHVKGRARIESEHVIDFRPGRSDIKMFENRIPAMRNPIDLYNRRFPATGVMARKLPKRSLGLSLSAENAAFENILGTPGNIQARKSGLYNRIRALLHCSSHGVLGLLVKERHSGHQTDDRLV